MGRHRYLYVLADSRFFTYICPVGESAGFCADGLTSAADFARQLVDIASSFIQTFGELA